MSAARAATIYACGGGGERALRRVLYALWVGVLPALAAAVVVRDLLPPEGSGVGGPLAGALAAARQHAVPFGAALFVLFSAMARYWRFRIPGGRYASALPAHVAPEEHDTERLRQWAAAAGLYASLSAPRARARLASSLGEETARGIDAALVVLRDAMQSGRFEVARAAIRKVRRLADGYFAARRRREAFGAGIAVVGAAALALGVRATWIESYDVLSGSMVPTLEPDDRVAGRRVRYSAGAGPARGDVVAFRSAAVAAGPGPLPRVLVKRVIGLPGDRIEMHGGVPVINGWRVPTCVAGEYLYVMPEGQGGIVRGMLVVEFLDDHAYLTVQTPGIRPMATPFDVPPGQVFVLGDNRGNSLDSRAYRQGRGAGVPFRAIEARITRFLVGMHGNGEADWSRFDRPLDDLARGVHVEAMDDRKLIDGIARCLAQRPAETHPPAGPAERTAQDVVARPTEGT